MTLPREHGFWVMLAAVLLSASGRSGWQLEVVAAALGTGLAALLVASLMHKTIRRVPWAQLFASTGLAALLIPAELVAGVPSPQLLANLGAWATLFTGCSLAVRAAFARSSRRQGRGNAGLLSLASVLSPASAALALYFFSPDSALRVAWVGTAGLFLVALWRPGAKQLKATGLSLALIVALALVAELWG